MNAENAGDERASTESDVPMAGDQHAQVARDVESVRPDADLARQSAETMRKAAEAAQSLSPALRAAMTAARRPEWRAAFESGARAQKFLRGFVDSPGFQSAIKSATRAQMFLQGVTDSPALRSLAEAAATSQKLAEVVADSPGFRAAHALAGSWQRVMDQHAAQFTAATQAIQAMIKQIPPWAIKVAEAFGAKLEEVYRAAAPPNWPVGHSMPWVDYTTAVTLSFKEGIPLAWAPDPETVRLLLAVPAGPGRSATCRAILVDRSTAILDHCQAQLDELANDPDTSADQQQMIEVARQSIQALRADLPAPAQAAAANLVDHLMRRLIAPLDGHRGVYKAAKERVMNLNAQVTIWSLHALAILRELATLMPIPKSLTEWWPDQGMPLPDTFSRHTTAHAIAEPDQVNPVNALIAVMLAVSLLLQEAASGWTALGAFWNTETDTEAGDTA